MATSPDEVLRRLRSICSALPAAVEATSFGHPAFQVDGKNFLVLEKHRGRLCIVFKAEPLHQRQLVESSSRFLVAPYIGKYGWVSMAAEGKLDWREVRSHVVGSHRLVASLTGSGWSRASRRPRKRAT